MEEKAVTAVAAAEAEAAMQGHALGLNARLDAHRPAAHALVKLNNSTTAASPLLRRHSANSGK